MAMLQDQEIMSGHEDVGTRLGFEKRNEFHWRDNADLNEMPICYKKKSSKQKIKSKKQSRLIPKILSRLMPKRSTNSILSIIKEQASDNSTAATESTAASDDSIRSLSVLLSESKRDETTIPTTLSQVEAYNMISHTPSQVQQQENAECDDASTETSQVACSRSGRPNIQQSSFIPAEHHLAETLKGILSGNEHSKAEFHMASSPWHWIVSDEEGVELVLLDDGHEDSKSTMPATEDDRVAECLSCSSSIESQGGKDDLPLMEQRLLATGLVSKDDYELILDEDGEGIDSDDYHASNVKTGVWEVTTYDEDGEEEDPAPNTSYIVTAIRMSDHVDTKKLRKAIFGVGQQHKRRPKVSMAPTNVAERLVGFQSGNMAPICHSINMYLYLEESILDKNILSLDQHWLRVGCGMFGQCLSIRADKFVEIAKKSGGMEECPLIRIKKKKNEIM